MEIIVPFDDFTINESIESKYPKKQGKIIVVMGAPGSGKGTLSKQLAKKYDFIHISTGDLIRKSDDPEIKKTAGKGNFISDDLAIKILRRELKKIDTSKNIIIDGFPRTLRQAKRLDKMLGRLGLGLNHALFLDLPDETSKERIRKRSTEEGREDDANEKIVEKRFKDYYEKTHPIVEAYDKSRKLIRIKASKGKDSVLRQVAEYLKLK